ncbi:MAG: dienelactone hydrolase family protein [Gemmatimonadetes bacterium]|nr:dienelactone hydrolase family protein [Gemmatimonadota bacterium]
MRTRALHTSHFFVLLTLCGAAAFHALPAGAQLPPDEPGSPARLNSSPRHGEWVDVPLPGSPTPIRSFVVYPERRDNAPVVIVIMEIYGLTDWIRGVADQLAADGFIAIAPDLLSGMGPGGGGTAAYASRDDVVAGVRGLTSDESMRRLDAVYAYARTIPAASGRIGVVGYCWGGATSFAYAVHKPELGAAVVYYGTSPADAAAYARINAPVLGLYGADDQRVNATIPTAQNAMGPLRKTYEVAIYDRAGHGFLRAQADREGANMRATQQAWPRTVAFFREHLGR